MVAVVAEVVVVVGYTEILRSGKKVMTISGTHTHTQISFPRSALLADKKFTRNCSLGRLLVISFKRATPKWLTSPFLYIMT